MSPKPKIAKIKDATKEGPSEAPTKEEPAHSHGNGGMIGEGDSQETREGGMTSES